MIKTITGNEELSKIKDEIIKRHQAKGGLIEYYSDNIDFIADAMCNNVEGYQRLEGFYHNIHGETGLVYLGFDGEVHIVYIK